MFFLAVQAYLAQEKNSIKNGRPKVDLVSCVDIKDTKCCMYMVIVLGAPLSSFEFFKPTHF